NDTDKDYPKDQVFQELFEQQVIACADHTAIVFENVKMSYDELNRRANQVAHYLRDNGVHTNDIVSILSERSLDMVIGVLGILKSGAAYLPIDPNYPANRIKYFLENSHSSKILINDGLPITNEFEGEIIRINDADILSQPEYNPEIINSVDDLAYMVYTSGSTGNPKGVMIQHKQYLNVTYAWRESYNLSQIPVNLLQMASFSFDVFAGDMSRALLNGGKMVICPEDIRLDPESLYKILETESISLLEATPSLVIPLMNYIKSNDLNTTFLKLVILGSDICKVEDFKTLLNNFGTSMRIVNSYGVTEATIDTSYYEETVDNIPDTGYVPIGKPLGNMEFLILDSDLNLLPTGVVGDLYIGGSGVAKGYFGREDLTIERFINNPFDAGKSLYKTGDLGRWTSDGNMEFLGRSDDQVKIRGFRIELGEIENALLQIEEIKEVIVSVRQESDASKYLCGYYVSPEMIQESDIIEKLRENLPDHMIPYFYVHLEAFPLTPNGKIDKRSLPAPSMEGKADYIPPSNEVESIIVKAWSEVLCRSVDKISTKDNFFEIGGDSMKTMQLKTKLNQSLDRAISIAMFFEYPTIASFAEYLNFEKELEQSQEKSLEVIEEESLNTLNEMLNLMDND
ncbi:non-ribosomal peptide synthetase, partial [Fulvivirga kasyanovii]